MKNRLYLFVAAALMAVSSNSMANQPSKAGAENKPETVIVPGDEIELSVYREADLKQRVKVGDDGRVKLHLIDPVRVTGMTQRQAEKAIQEAYGKDILVNPSVTVSIYPQLRQVGKIIVQGRVGAAGVYQIPAGKRSISILEAIGLAGGFTRYSRKSKVQVRREENGVTVVHDVNVGKIMTNEKAKNFQIKSGDIIFVPEIIII